MQNGAQFPVIPEGIFVKTYSREFPNGGLARLLVFQRQRTLK